MSTHAKKHRRILPAAVCTLLILFACITVYASSYYRAGEQALSSLQSDDAVTVTVEKNGTVIFAPLIAKRGLIFYPGGKVEHTAYAPLLKALAEEGWFCVLLEMPLRLAVLDADAADGIPEQFPFISEWYIGGHSLGGAMAASYAADYSDFYEGLILLGSYSTKDISKTDLNTYTLYGSEDKVLNLVKYESYRDNLPATTQELIIDGGCHAYFGDYGPQDGDGEPAITAMEQVRISVDFISPTN